MAGARLEKVGTIFARLNSMLRKNVLSAEDKPIWYEIYALHPPLTEPRYDQVAPEGEIREIFYEEDIIRAKFHGRVKRRETINLSDNAYESDTKKFIDLYNNLKAQGALDDEKIFEVALVQLNARGKQQVEELEDEIEEAPQVDYGLVRNFTQALEESNAAKSEEKPTTKPKKSGSIDIKSLF